MDVAWLPDSTGQHKQGKTDTRRDNSGRTDTATGRCSEQEVTGSAFIIAHSGQYIPGMRLRPSGKILDIQVNSLNQPGFDG